MPRWATQKAGGRYQVAQLSALGVTCAIAIGGWMASGSRPGESGALGDPRERWVYTTQGQFSWHGLLALAPIYRHQIEGVLLDKARVYLGVDLSGSGIQFVSLDRHRGDRVWERRLALRGRPTGGRFVQAGGRVVAAVYDLQKNELVILGISPGDSAIVWQVSLPGVPEPAVYEQILEADADGETVTVYLLETKQRNRLTLRATDGQRVAESSYNAYLWPFGTRRAGGLILGYDGIPDERRYQRLLAFREGTGHLAWTLPLSPPWSSPPRVVGDSLLITSGTHLLRIDLNTGQPRWRVNLGGQIPIDSDPPLVLGSRIAVTYNASPHPERRHWKLSIRRLSDGGQEAEVFLGSNEIGFPSVLRSMGELVIVQSDLVLHVVDLHSRAIVARLDFEKRLSRLVYADPPAMRLAGSDVQGFVVVATDGQLWYFSAEDFRSLVPPPVR